MTQPASMLNCAAHTDVPDRRPPDTTAVDIEGFLSYAPELALGHDGFAEGVHEKLDDLEDNHFWFRCRRDLLAELLLRSAPEARSFCEIGCGNGSVLAAIAAAAPQIALCGIEASLAGLHSARRRVPRARLLQADATRLPFAAEFDAAGVFDVLEHIDDDDAVLAGIHAALRPGGLLLVTVPQHRWLWSKTDVEACHRRRYTRRMLADKLTEAGFTIERFTSYLVWLLPLLALSRLKSDVRHDGSQRPALWIDRICERATRCEIELTRRGWDHPWGGSLVAVARRNGRAAIHGSSPTRDIDR